MFEIKKSQLVAPIICCRNINWNCSLHLPSCWHFFLHLEHTCWTFSNCVSCNHISACHFDVWSSPLHIINKPVCCCLNYFNSRERDAFSRNKNPCSEREISFLRKEQTVSNSMNNIVSWHFNYITFGYFIVKGISSISY